jgi:replication-associated recombination protein RarA
MILHPQTASELENIYAHPPHALLISGEEGSGKPTLARELTQRLLEKDTLEADSTFRHFTPEKNSIGIGIIRELQKFLHLKTTGRRQIRRVIIIEDAHMMTHEAQNALLKILEEPPADTVIILTAVQSRNILPTIYSRVQQLVIKTPSLQQALDEYGKQGFKSVDIERSYGLSNGQQGLLTALLGQSSEHELVEAITLAKVLLAKTSFERLAMVDELAKQKSSIPLLLKALKRIARSGLMHAANHGKDNQVQRWHKLLTSVQQSELMLAHNPNSKLLLTNLMLTI